MTTTNSGEDAHLQTMLGLQNVLNSVNQNATNQAQQNQPQFTQAQAAQWKKHAKQQQEAEKRILAHLMYSGADPNEQESTRKQKLRNRKLRKNFDQKEEEKSDSKAKDFNLEKTLRSILGSEYSAPKTGGSKKKRKKKKKRKGKNQSQQKVVVELEESVIKSPEQRQFKYCTPSSNNCFSCAIDSEDTKFTIEKSRSNPGLYIPELNLQLEMAENLNRNEKNMILLTSADKEKLYSFPYHCEQAAVMCYPDVCDNGITSLYNAWNGLIEGVTPLLEEEAAQQEEEKQEVPQAEENQEATEEETAQDEDKNEDVEEEKETANEENETAEEQDEDEEDDEDGLEMVTFKAGSVEFFSQNGLYVQSYGVDDDTLAYAVGKSQNKSFISMTESATPSFIRRNSKFFDSKVVVVNCNYLSQVEDGAAYTTSWTDLAAEVSKRPDSLFLLTNFDGRYEDSEICSFFQSLVDGESSTDLSNVVLCIAEPRKEEVEVDMTEAVDL